MRQGNTDSLAVLQEQERQDAILLAEIGALIHDLGKRNLLSSMLWTARG